ncbi:BID domain-containing T4SS effector [Bartonella sp. CB169]|uniref:BID domain-containing T4SS effector n=1 Tax=Bartonella sp. CB169 TaxID=3112257 RepID=UPI00300E5A25
MNPDYSKSSSEKREESLYAKVNKQPRGPAEVIYADVNVKRTREHKTKNQQEEVVYADVNVKRTREHKTKNQQEEVVYADVNIKRTREHKTKNQQEEVVYADVNVNKSEEQRRRLSDHLRENVDVQYCAAEVSYWSRVVYGNPGALNKQLENIRKNPEQGEQISMSVAANPKGIGKLAGRKILGMKTSSRRAAEEGFTPLCEAIDRYVNAVKTVERNLGVEKKQESPGRREDIKMKDEMVLHHSRAVKQQGRSQSAGKSMAFAF